MPKHLSIAHLDTDHDPNEWLLDDIADVRTKIEKYCRMYEGKRVFLFGDSGSFFDEREYPVNRTFIHESTDEILRFFDAFAPTAKPELKNDVYISFYFVHMYKTYEDAFRVAETIITEMTQTDLKEDA